MKEFEVSGEILVLDPCYERSDIEGLGVVADALPGKWYIEAIPTKERDRKICGIFAVHSSQLGKLHHEDCLEQEGYASVDSGTCGIYAKEKYPQGGVGFDEENGYSLRELDYGRCFDGFGGDGCYGVYSRRVDGKVAALFVDFDGDMYDEDSWDE